MISHQGTFCWFAARIDFRLKEPHSELVQMNLSSHSMHGVGNWANWRCPFISCAEVAVGSLQFPLEMKEDTSIWFPPLRSYIGLEPKTSVNLPHGNHGWSQKKVCFPFPMRWVICFRASLLLFRIPLHPWEQLEGIFRSQTEPCLIYSYKPTWSKGISF